MHVRCRPIFTVWAFSIMLAFTVNSATAGRLSIAGRGFRLTWLPMWFGNEDDSITVRCPITLEGSLHSSTNKKVFRELVGVITRTALQPEACTGGTVSIQNETLPWHTTYAGFEGSLPRNIRKPLLFVKGFSALVQMTVIGFRINCLFRDQGRVEETLVQINYVKTETNQIVEAGIGHTRYLSLFSGSELCFRRWYLSGGAEVFELGRASRLLLTLI
jgi:hypothetical protein